MKMANDFRSARFWAREMIEAAMFDGARAIDATMGNGHDTLLLCELAGLTGQVLAFDIQPLAHQNTQKRLQEAGVPENYRLILDSHSHMEQYADAAICLAAAQCKTEELYMED